MNHKSIAALALCLVLALGLTAGACAQTLSPDAEQIVKTMTDIGEGSGFAIWEVPYDKENMVNHKNGEDVPSHPFLSMYCTVGDMDAMSKAYGYDEKELFFSGTTNVYGLSEEGENIPVITATGDYTNRILVRYPQDAAKFSGRVYVEILNASSGVDLEDVFRHSFEHHFSSGDIYVGVTSKNDCGEALIAFDPERYADIDWRINDEDPASGQQGMFWDMLSQLGVLLKTNPQAVFGDELGAKVDEFGKIYLMGKSQSGICLNNYLTVFYPYINNALDGKDIWDGYFNVVGPNVGAVYDFGTFKYYSGGLSQGVMPVDKGWTQTEEPYIVVVGESEASAKTYHEDCSLAYDRTGDHSEEDWKFRLYEVAGAPHSDPTEMILTNNFEIAAAKAKGTSRDPKNYKENHVETDLHLDLFVCAAMVNLDNWVRSGVVPPPADTMWIEFTETQSVKDEWGNTLGGLRSPLLDAPLAHYFCYINNDVTPFESSTHSMPTEGSMIWFTQEEIAARYPGGYEQYTQEFTASAKAALDAGYILPAGYDKLMAYMENVSAFGRGNETILGAQSAVPAVKSVSSSEENGYVTAEYFLSGSANLYNLVCDNSLLVRESGLAYTNRILVRAPKTGFNGNVYVELLGKGDALCEIAETGAAYVAVTCSPAAVHALKQESDVYAPLSWASPKSWHYDVFAIDKEAGQTAEEARAAFFANAAELPYTDTGLVWDILSQTGAAIRANAGGILPGEAKNVVLSAANQSSIVDSYFVFVDFLSKNGAKAPFDGFTGVTAAYPSAKINQFDKTSTVKDASAYEAVKALGLIL